MNLVALDGSVVTGWVLPDEPWHRAALGLARDLAEGRLQAVVAPNLAFEVRNAIVKAAHRGRLGWDQVAARFAMVDRYELAVTTMSLSPASLTEVCRIHGVGWGDAHHVLLAMRLSCPLITADARLIRALQGSNVWVESILDRPSESDPGQQET